jgi:hypothetical protein
MGAVGKAVTRCRQGLSRIEALSALAQLSIFRAPQVHLTDAYRRWRTVDVEE